MSDQEYSLVTQKTPIPCIDLVILRNRSCLETLLFKRKTGYESGRWCLLGGRVGKNEPLENAIKRHVSDAGVKVRVISPFSPNFPAWVNDALQDKTKHPIVGIYPVKIVSGSLKNKGEEFVDIKWFPVNKLPKMGYDCRSEVLKCLEQLKKFNKSFFRKF